jgi:transcriptional regulator with XRE-family HTH domain
MTLAEYCPNPGDASKLAARLGVSPMTVYRWLSGEHAPTKRVMKKLIAITGGKVTADSFYATARKAI